MATGILKTCDAAAAANIPRALTVTAVLVWTEEEKRQLQRVEDKLRNNRS